MYLFLLTRYQLCKLCVLARNIPLHKHTHFITQLYTREFTSFSNHQMASIYTFYTWLFISWQFSTRILTFPPVMSSLHERTPAFLSVTETLSLTSPRPPVHEHQCDQRPLMCAAKSTSWRRSSSTQSAGMAAQIFWVQVQYRGLLSCPGICAGGFSS
jgi:hypothetical protein